MIKRGVSLYSYQQEQFFKRMTLRDMGKEVHDNLKTDGIEIIDQAVVRQYPYPSDEFVAEFRDLMAEFDMTAVTMDCALPGFVDSKNEEKTERNAGYLVVSHSGGGMLRQGTRKGIRRTPANRGMRAHWVVKGLDISEDVCHGMCP